MNFDPRSWFDSSNDTNGTDFLKTYLEKQENTLSLEAEFAEPAINMVGEPTAIFHLDTYHDGEQYGYEAREFVIPDNGLEDADSPLAQFMSRALGDNADDLSRDNIDDLEGVTADASLKANGNYELAFNHNDDDAETTEDN